MADHFNAIDYAHQLKSAGVPAAQAEVHASALAQVVESCVSAAADTSSMRGELLLRISTLEVTLRAEIKQVETSIRAEMKDLETRLLAEIREVDIKLRADLGGRIDRLEAKMAERFRWQWWANGVMVAMLIGLYFR
jgi:hypothetical protein